MKKWPPLCASAESANNTGVYACNLFVAKTEECRVACPNTLLILTSVHGFVMGLFFIAVSEECRAVGAAVKPSHGNGIIAWITDMSSYVQK